MDALTNKVIKYEDGLSIRVLYQDQDTNSLIVIDMEQKRFPFVLPIDEVNNQLNSGGATIINDNTNRLVHESELTEAEISGRDQAWEIVSFLMSRCIVANEIFDSTTRLKYINDTAKTFRISRSTVKRFLIKYWKGGGVKGSLIPSLDKCGAKGTIRRVGDKKRGRPRKYSATSGVNIDEIIQKFFKIGLNRFFYNDRKNPLKTAYELTIKEYFTKSDEGTDEKNTVLIDPTQIPSYGQFYYWYRKYNNARHEIAKRLGERVYQQRYRPIIGSTSQDAGMGPAVLYQIDSTIFDVYLVSSMNRDLIIGRPVLFLVIDCYSRMLTGVHVTIENFNSYSGVMLALVNSMTAKEEYCRKYGVTLDNNDWDVSCIPQRILSDRGELNNSLITNAIESLGVTISHTPPFRADYKGCIEQAFRQMGLKIKPFVDGVVKNGKNVVGIGDPNYRLKANLSLDEFTQIIIKCILFYNNHHVLSSFVSDEMMIDEGIEKIPREIWKHGVINRKGILRTLSKDTIEMSLLPGDSATVTPRGVSFRGLLYASAISLHENWFGRARVDGNWKVKITYNPLDMSRIYTISEDGKSQIEHHLVDSLQKFNDKSIFEFESIMMLEKKTENEGKERELQAKVKLFGAIEKIVDTARIQSKAEIDQDQSKRSRLKGIKDNLKNERAINRKRNQKNQAPEFLPSDVQESGDERDRELTLIKNIQKGKIDER